ncbi:MAG: hypothetical protein R3286_00625 [Gammaproteobacteria bacterium]|nr:hypothetical protein [Gammaproteobacteria bacterium]
MKRRKLDGVVDASLLFLLEQRFGDEQLYLEGDEDRATLAQALALGLVSDDGCLTAEGKRFSLRYE